MLKMNHDGTEYEFPDGHSFIPAIMKLVELAIETTGAEEDALLDGANGSTSPFASSKGRRRQLRALWRRLKHAKDYRKNLLLVARAPADGIGQKDLMVDLGIGDEPEKFRGMQTGIARICRSLGLKNPLESSGYKQSNRIYFMNPETAQLILDVEDARKRRRKKAARKGKKT